MSKYHKIQTVWLRDPDTNHKTLLEGQWAKPEFEYLQGAQWEFTEKVDGTNVRLYRDGLRVGGKTDNAQLHVGLVSACREITVSEAFAALPDSMVLYGEGYGEKIQKGGGLYRKGQGFILFDAWCGLWLERVAVEEIANDLGIPVAPIVSRGTLGDMVALVQDGIESRVGERLAEGLVARPVCELLNRRGERVITKLKYKDFRHG